SHSLDVEKAARWLSTRFLPALVLVVPLACSPALVDPFDLPKLFLLKLGLAAVLLTIATGRTVEIGLLNVRTAQTALVFLSVSLLATVASIEPRTSLIGVYGDDLGLLTLIVTVGYFFLSASWIRTDATLT